LHLAPSAAEALKFCPFQSLKNFNFLVSHRRVQDSVIIPIGTAQAPCNDRHRNATKISSHFFPIAQQFPSEPTWRRRYCYKRASIKFSVPTIFQSCQPNSTCTASILSFVLGLSNLFIFLSQIQVPQPQGRLVHVHKIHRLIHPQKICYLQRAKIYLLSLCLRQNAERSFNRTKLWDQFDAEIIGKNVFSLLH
jgi:hypothetical protein